MSAQLGTKTCSRCKFFVRTNPDLRAPGECRASPPTTIAVMTPQGHGTMGAFPPVQPGVWCGAWEPSDQIRLPGLGLAADEKQEQRA